MEERKEDFLNLSKGSLELIAIEQCLITTLPARKQAQELINQAIDKERSIANQVLNSLLLKGEATAIERDDTGYPIAIRYEPHDS